MNKTESRAKRCIGILKMRDNMDELHKIKYQHGHRNGEISPEDQLCC